MPQAAVYSTEAGVLMGMLGGDIVKEAEAEVVGWFARDKVEFDIMEWSLQ